MSEKETSGEIATIAGRVLNIEPTPTGAQISSTSYNDLLTQARKLAGSALSQREIVQAQIDGEDIFVLGRQQEIPSVSARVGDFVVSANLNGGLTISPSTADEKANFDFYVDGYTLKSTDTIGEILVTSYDGKNVVIKSSQLTAFLERRLTPANVPPE
jgi:hypothetical protein